jgi:hypothetical protein
MKVTERKEKEKESREEIEGCKFADQRQLPLNRNKARQQSANLPDKEKRREEKKEKKRKERKKQVGARKREHRCVKQGK